MVLGSPLESKQIKPSRSLDSVNYEYSLEGLMLNLKLQYFDHMIQTADSLDTSLMLGEMKGRRRRGHQRVRWLDGITDAMDMNLGTLWEMVGQRGLACCSPQGSVGSQRIEHDWVTE